MANLSSFYPQPVIAGPEEAPEDGIIYGRKDADWVDITEPANLQVRRGTAAEVEAITPLEGEPVWETDTKKLVVGDGFTVGGITVGKFPLDGTLMDPMGTGASTPAAGRIFVSSEVEAIGGSFLGGPFVTGETRGAGAVDLQGERIVSTQVASGPVSFIAGSRRSTASATNSVVLGSSSTICSGFQSVAMGCSAKTVSGFNSFSFGSNSSGNYCVGFHGVSDRFGMLSHGTFSNVSNFGPTERVQSVELILKQRTTDTTPTNMVLDDTGGVTSSVTIPVNLAMFGQIDICAIQESTGAEAAHYIRKFGIRNVGGTTELIGSTTAMGTDYESSAGFDVELTANNTNDTLNVTVTGIPSTNLRWVGIIRATEVELS
jgi:hypothetical protein